MNGLRSFKITKLHGYQNFNLKFKDNSLILVGENGTGKTTVLRMLFYVLTGQFASLSKYKYDTLEININGNNQVLKYSDLQKNISFLDNNFLRRLPPIVRHRLRELIVNGNGTLSMPEIERICDRYDVPFHYVVSELNIFDQPNLFDEHKKSGRNKRLVEFNNAVQSSMKSTVLYLPTYRRIEQELGIIFKDIDEDELRNRKKQKFHRIKRSDQNFVELIEFGMKDVEDAIQNTLERLKEFARESLNTLTLGYLGDVVDEKYTEVNVEQIQKASEITIKNVLYRIDERILSEESKKHLFETIENVRQGVSFNDHAKVICHYFLKLLNFQQELEEKESKISSFCNICNKYMTNKLFEYVSSTFNFTILSKSDGDSNREIKIHQLSSGEKQIVSLFSHLYLSDTRKYFVMIDEPELSLSVPWQRQFLADIHKSEFCTGMLAVTHSPFIYENHLKKYTHGLGEFIELEKMQ